MMDDFNDQVIEMMTRCKKHEQRLGSRAGSATTSQDTRVTEVTNGLLVSRPMKASEEPGIIDLQEYTRGRSWSGEGAARGGKTGSVNDNSSVNKVEVIADFLNSDGTD